MKAVAIIVLLFAPGLLGSTYTSNDYATSIVINGQTSEIRPAVIVPETRPIAVDDSEITPETRPIVIPSTRPIVIDETDVVPETRPIIIPETRPIVIDDSEITPETRPIVVPETRPLPVEETEYVPETRPLPTNIVSVTDTDVCFDISFVQELISLIYYKTTESNVITF